MEGKAVYTREPLNDDKLVATCTSGSGIRKELKGMDESMFKSQLDMMTYCFTHARVAVMRESVDNKCLGCGEPEHSLIAGDNANGTATLESRRTVSPKVKRRVIIYPAILLLTQEK